MSGLGESNLNCDIAVIGASSAGLYVASQLARSGKKVLVFEQKTAAQPMPRRTLIVTPALAQLLPELLASLVLHQVRSIQLTTRNVSARVTLTEADLIIDRSKLIQLLSEQAQANGAEIFYGHRFQTLEADLEGVRLYFKNAGSKTGSVVARGVIGADGIRSEVAAAAGLEHVPTVPLVQAEIELPKDWDSTLTQVWFDTDETRYFFWLIPESIDRGVVGLIGDPHARVNDTLNNFIARHGFKPMGFQAGTVAMYRPGQRIATRIGSAPILLVGDAAGHVKVTTVGGTVSGILGGGAAVRSILNGTRYEQELRAVQRELNLHWYMRCLLDRMKNSSYDGLAGALDPEALQFLSEHNRDEMTPHFWSFLLLRPKLLAQLATSLVRLPVRSRTVSNTFPTIKEL